VSLLVDKGLAVREPRPNDRRCIEIRLTEQGCAIYRELQPTVMALDERLLDAFNAAEREQFDRLFARLEQHAASWHADMDLPKADRSRSHRRPGRGNP
jgi:DNA-binding MarR family transcriptional regulator